MSVGPAFGSSELQGALVTAEIGVWSWELATARVRWSAETERLFGLEPGTFGQTVEALLERVPIEDRPFILASLEKAVTERSHSFRVQHRGVRPDGSVFWVEGRGGVVYDLDGAVTGMLGTVQDITEQKRLEDQLLQAQKLDALAQLAGGVAHDFNNLLLVITLAHAEVTAFSERGEPAAPSDLDDMRVAVQRASELTRSLLAFSRRQPSERQALDLGLLVERALPMLGRATGKGFRVDMVMDQGGVLAWGDPAQLQLILINLAMNARDASPKSGAATLRIATASFDPTSPGRPPELPPGDYATVSLSDDGDGMSQETQLRIFEPFYTTKAPGMGTGLGLATVHGFLRQMGGAIRVSSELGVGSTFTLYLPQAELATPAVQKTAALASVGGTERVLLVEDEPTVRRLASRTLRDRGYEIHEVNSAEEALALPLEEVRRFKLVLSDFRLPGIDGRTLLTILRERAPELRTLLMSGFIGEPAEPNESEHAFIGKPFTVDGLARRVRETLDSPVTPAPRA